VGGGEDCRGVALGSGGVGACIEGDDQTRNGASQRHVFLKEITIHEIFFN
jgi:hypothetical protein